jgi:hypothetical protein
VLLNFVPALINIYYYIHLKQSKAKQSKAKQSKAKQSKAKQSKAVPLHAMVVLWGRGGIIPTHS